MHPITLAAVLLLVVNDWYLKSHFGPSVITGKLSDLAGLAFAPVILSAAIGFVLHVAARLGARVDPSLSLRRLVACVVATGVGFAAVKLSPPIAERLAHVLGYLGRPASFYEDWTDLLTLPALADVRRAGASPERVAELAAAIDAWDPAKIDRLL